MVTQIVSIFTLDEEGNEEEMGSVIWDGDDLTIISNTNSDFMSDLLLRPVFLNEGDDLKDVSSNENPSAWFYGLNKNYKGSRMWATDPRALTDDDLADTTIEE